MAVTNFGIFWTMVCFAAALKGPKAMTKVLLFSCLFQAGAIVVVKDSASISPLAFTCLFYCVRSVAANGMKVKKPSALWMQLYFLMWLSLVVTSLLAPVLFHGLKYMKATDWVEYGNYDGHIAFYGLLILLLYGLTGMLVYQNKVLTATELYNLVCSMVIFSFLVACWQYLSIMQYIPRSDFLADFIYSNATTRQNLAYYVDTDPSLRIYKSVLGIRLYSCFMEPSYCGGFLGIMFTYLIARKKITKKDKVLIAIILAMTVMTFSSTAYAAVAVGGLAVAFTRKQFRQMMKIIGRGLALVGIGLVGVTALQLWDTVNRLIINKMDTHSAFIRGQWNVNCLKTFFDTYGLGLGYGNVRGSSLSVTLLGSFGLVGTVLYVLFAVSLMRLQVNGASDPNYEKEGRVLKIMLFVILCAQVIAVPTMDYTVFWMAVFLLFARCQLGEGIRVRIYHKKFYEEETGGVKNVQETLCHCGSRMQPYGTDDDCEGTD